MKEKLFCRAFVLHAKKKFISVFSPSVYLKGANYALTTFGYSFLPLLIWLYFKIAHRNSEKWFCNFFFRKPTVNQALTAWKKKFVLGKNGEILPMHFITLMVHSVQILQFNKTKLVFTYLGFRFYFNRTIWVYQHGSSGDNPIRNSGSWLKEHIPWDFA